MSDLGTNNTLAVSRALGTTALPCFGSYPLRAMTASTGVTDSTGRKPGAVFPKALALSGVGTGILTSFPVVRVELRADLGSTNPWLIDSAKEPLLVRSSRFSPDYRCYCDQNCRYCTIHTSSRPYFHSNSTPTYVVTMVVLYGLGNGFEPRSFWAPRTSAGKLLRFS